MKSIYVSDRYVKIWERYDKATSLRIVLENDKAVFEIVLLVKRIVGEDDLFEAYTPYGYGGPVLIQGSQDATFPFEKFVYELAKRNIVDVFVRLSPFLKNQRYFPMNILELNRYTVSRTLSKMSHNDVLRTLSKGTKWSIRKSINCGVDISLMNGKDIGKTEIANFHKLYSRSMKVANAADYYFLNRECIKNHFAYLGDNAHLFVAKLDGRWIGASLFMRDERMCHYHLAASDRNFSRFYPADRMLFEAIVFYGKEGKELVHLGGGLSLSEDDSLFRFKKKFGNTINEFYIGKLVVKNKLYEELRFKKGIRNSNYFLINDALERKP